MIIQIQFVIFIPARRTNYSRSKRIKISVNSLTSQNCSNIFSFCISRFFKLCKMAKFSSEQIKENTGYSQNTLMKFFTSSMKKLENKAERNSNEDALPKQKVESLKTEV